ncbi:hypothetical protein B0T24DRAFT_609198 [Lasiosphaeria ovina]|uniref:Uncharacterized protein n=1 Tax=Lasiosphaeria ovina TaxID=92902 RepID=A0AAE0NN81_9PEZI|nr:hypothetical protein B0T24DRAFT_609198 [Lasiosphaeria ovina]
MSVPLSVRNYQISPDLLRTLSRYSVFVRRLITRDSTTCFSVPPHRPCSAGTGPCTIKVRPGARQQVTAVGFVSRRPARFSGLSNLIPGPAPWPPRGSYSATTAPISPVAADGCDRDLVSVWTRLERVQERRVQQAWKHGGLGYWLQQVGCRPGRVTVTVNHFAGTELENYSGCSALAGPPPGRWFAISARLPVLPCHDNLGVALDIRSGKRAVVWKSVGAFHSSGFSSLEDTLLSVMRATIKARMRMTLRRVRSCHRPAVQLGG